MERLYREGRVRAIGVSNFQPDRVMDLIVHNDVVPTVNQIETQKFLQDNNVQIESWGPVGSRCGDDRARPRRAAGRGAPE